MGGSGRKAPDRAQAPERPGRGQTWPAQELGASQHCTGDVTFPHRLPETELQLDLLAFLKEPFSDQSVMRAFATSA